MRIQKINATPTEPTTETNFRAVKLKTSTIKSARRTLTGDTLELRKGLPKNKNTKSEKLYGYDPTGRNNQENKEFTTADAIGLGAMFAVGLAASLL